MTTPPTDSTSLIVQPHELRVGRVSAALGLSWERCHRAPYDLLIAIDELIAHHERELTEARLPARDRVEGEGS